MFFDVAVLLKTIGYAGFFAIIFAESGVLVGFLLPGDSLIFTAGFLASQDVFDLAIILTLGFLGAVLGDSFGYAFGKKIGPKIFKKENSLFFHKKHLDSAKLFYEKHGRQTIILARFVPVIRTFAPILAGVGQMKYSSFLLFNLIGGFIWVFLMALLGYFFGALIPNADQYILPIVLVIIILSSLPTLIHIWRKWRRK